MKNIIDFNTQKKYDNKIIYPTNNRNIDLPNSSIEYFVDFETMNKYFGGENMIYLIGMYVKYPDNTCEFFKYFAKDMTNDSQVKIVTEWRNKINEINNKYNCIGNIYCWSNAENNFMNMYNRMNPNNKIEIIFHDLKNTIKENNILIKDNIYGFSIKSVSKYMKLHKLVDISYEDSGCSAGDMSIISALEYYENGNKTKFNELIEYNKIDCILMYEILNYFRNYFS